MFTSPLKKLRQSTWLTALPDTVAVPDADGVDVGVDEGVATTAGLGVFVAIPTDATPVAVAVA